MASAAVRETFYNKSRFVPYADNGDLRAERYTPVELNNTLNRADVDLSR